MMLPAPPRPVVKEDLRRLLETNDDDEDDIVDDEREAREAGPVASEPRVMLVGGLVRFPAPPRPVDR